MGLVDLTGLALAPTYSVLPRYHDGLAQWAPAWAREQHRTVLALPERGGIRYHDHAFTVIGPSPTVEIDQSASMVHPVGASWSSRAP